MATRSLNLYSRNKTIPAGATESTASGNLPGSRTAAPFFYRVKAGGNANDTAAGVGCRSIILRGVSATGEAVEEIIATAGTNASANGIVAFNRINSIDVYSLGTALSTPTADITIEKTTTGDVALLETSPGTWGGHQYTVPLGMRALLRQIVVTSNKTAFTLTMKRYKQSVVAGAAQWSSSIIQNDFHTTGDSGGNLVVNLNIVLDPLEMIWLRVHNKNAAEADVTSIMRGTLYTL